MGLYVNPNSPGFEEMVQSGLYVDKTGLISYMNSVMGSTRKLVCSTRPRRFGKTFAAQMLTSFYSRKCSSRDLFSKFRVADDPRFDQLVNNCDVITWDTTEFLTDCEDGMTPVERMNRKLSEDLRNEFSDVETASGDSFSDLLLKTSVKTGRRFVFIIDEWDAIFRECPKDQALQNAYINFLRSIFKGRRVALTVEAAYMTGILPIKKYGTQSALTDFNEVSMIDPYDLAEYIGFTDREVAALCERCRMDFGQMRRWYDGYQLGESCHVYCPSSVMKAVSKKRYGSYWTQSETYGSLKHYIELNFDGLRDAVIAMLSGASVTIDPLSFQNDLTSIASKDDALTLLVHLGYLAYDAARQSAFIPNEEIRREFVRAVKNTSRPELLRIIERSDAVLQASQKADAPKLAELIEQVHNEQGSLRFYNNEQALRAVIRMAYLSAGDEYERFEEMEAGTGYADMILVPKASQLLPALILEFKWDRNPETAVAQIKKRRYADVLQKFRFSGAVHLIGISYDPQSKKHRCVIEKLH